MRIDKARYKWLSNRHAVRELQHLGALAPASAIQLAADLTAIQATDVCWIQLTAYGFQPHEALG